MSKTKIVNVYNQTPRQILCTANVHYRPEVDEKPIKEPLETGKQYTFIRGESKAYGEMVFIKEVPSRTGFPEYLFDELETYDIEILKKAREKDLDEKLQEGYQQSKEGKYITKEELKEHLKKLPKIFEKQNDPERIPEIIEALQKTWERFPQLRLGQLILNICYNKDELWNMEDDKILEEIRKLCDR